MPMFSSRRGRNGVLSESPEGWVEEGGVQDRNHGQYTSRREPEGQHPTSLFLCSIPCRCLPLANAPGAGEVTERSASRPGMS